ncbi:hypothetical protein [Aeromonas media]|uniref:Uncharacterized protein n=1 Tax=Aeromonas media TaxID=651 RepID=A0AAW5RUT5_AERME|nr:hypothetical protein [Aeromonas media]MCV3290863.1 hypothetical protein [Aeromonas media]
MHISTWRLTRQSTSAIDSRQDVVMGRADTPGVPLGVMQPARWVVIVAKIGGILVVFL